MRNFFLAAAIVLSTGIVYGQTAPDVPYNAPAPPSPNVSGILKYGDIPIDYHTGTPDISIPIYDINVGELHVPISLSYHASGFKVNENASDVGLGWTLNAEGILSQSVLGEPDDGSYITNEPRFSGGVALNPGHVSDDYYFVYQLFNHGTDGVPDLYNYSLNGHSGKFINAQISTSLNKFWGLPQQDDSIIQTHTPGVTYLAANAYTWEIITADGTQYFFNDPAEQTLSKPSAFSGTGGSTLTDWVLTANTWYVTKIVSANNIDTITFSYDDVSYNTFEGYSGVVTSWANNSLQPVCCVGGCAFLSGGGLPFLPLGANSGVINETSAQTAGKQLHTINFRNGSIEFHPSSAPREDLSLDAYAIDKVIIKNGNGAVIKVAHMNYDYYNPGTHDPYKERLKLNSVVFNSNTATVSTADAQTYTINYNSTPLPVKTTYAFDHWGYYNGATGNSTMIPSASVSGDFSYSGANREPDAASMMAGIIQSITYPTGGYTKYDFEPNDVSLPNTTYYVDSPEASVSFTYSMSPIIQHAIDLDHVFYVDPVRFPTGVTATFYGNCSPPSGSVYTAFNEAHQYIALYKDGITTQVINYPFPAGGTYDYSTTVTLAAGHSYAVSAGSHFGSFMVHAYLSINVPHIQDNSHTIVGGLRIKQITNHDQYTNKDNVKKYTYVMPNSTASSGLIWRMPEYISYNYDIEQCPPAFAGGVPLVGCISATNQGFSISSNSVNHAGQGNLVNYSYVEEIDGYNGQGGKSIYHYSNYHDYTQIGGAIEQSWWNGMLFDKTDYDRWGNKVHKTTNHWIEKIPTGTPPFQGQDWFCIAADPCVGGSPFVNNSRYRTDPYFFPSDWWYTDTTKDSSYYSNGDVVFNKSFVYGNPAHKQITQINSDFSDGSQLQQLYKYPKDYVVPTGYTATGDLLTITYLQSFHIDNTPIEQITLKGNGSSFSAISSRYFKWANYNFTSGAASLSTWLPYQEWILRTTTPIALGVFSPSQVTTSGTYANVTISPSYKLENTVNSYDVRGNVIDLTTVPAQWASLYFYSNQYLVAKAKNATNGQIAYSGFETGETGNWTYNTANITGSSHLTGNNAYQLSSSSDINWSNASAYSSDVNAIVSFWAKAGGSPVTVNSTSAITGNTQNGWTYYEYRISVSGGVTIHSSGSTTIDELRLYSEQSQMETYTYDPLVGMTAKCDINNTITYYEYDSDGRLVIVRDADGNIVKKYEYGVQVSE